VKECKIPTESSMAIVKPIFKKGDNSYCSNYRGISLLGSCYKIYLKIITRRFQTITECLVEESQNGIR
jgi:hypothetical protein